MAAKYFRENGFCNFMFVVSFLSDVLQNQRRQQGSNC